MIPSVSKRISRVTLVAGFLSMTVAPGKAPALPSAPYDYHQPAQALVTRGTQALMMCNGLFVSHRTLEQIYALFEKIGMRSTLPGVDRFGDFVLSSQVYTNARDLARLGLLYLDEGVWNGQQVLPESWVRFVRTPAPSTLGRGRFCGGQWWLVPDEREDVPQDAYSTAGHRGQYAVVVPSYDLVIVRRGLDWLPGQHRFSQWDLTREVLRAFSNRPWGEKLKQQEGY